MSDDGLCWDCWGFREDRKASAPQTAREYCEEYQRKAYEQLSVGFPTNDSAIQMGGPIMCEFMESYASSRVASLQSQLGAYKDACGDLSPEDLERLLDKEFASMGVGEMTDALSALAKQGQDLDLAEEWQKRAEAAESSVASLQQQIEQDHRSETIEAISQSHDNWVNRAERAEKKVASLQQELDALEEQGKLSITMVPRENDPRIWVARYARYVTTGIGPAEALRSMAEIFERENSGNLPAEQAYRDGRALTNKAKETAESRLSTLTGIARELAEELDCSNACLDGQMGGKTKSPATEKFAEWEREGGR